MRGVVALIALVALGAAACNAILGIDPPNAVAGDGGGFADTRPTSDAIGPDHPTGTDAPADGLSGMDAGPMDADAGLTDAVQRGDAFDGYCGCSGDACAAAVVVASSSFPTVVVADSNGVYWADGTDLAIQGIEFASGTALTVPDDAGLGPSALAMSPSQVVWADTLSGSIKTLARPPPGALTVLGPTSGAVRAMTLALAEVFLGSVTGIGACALTGCPGGPRNVTAVTGGVNEIVTDGTNLYFLNSQSLSTCAISGCTPTVLTSVMNASQGLAIVNGGASSTLYWISGSDILTCAPMAGCTPSPFYSGFGSPRSVAADGANVYWTDPLSGTVMKQAVVGGAPTVLAANRPGPAHIALGDSCVFWTENGSQPGGVLAVAK